MNNVERLYHYRKSISTKPFLARGFRIERCQQCLISVDYCICQYKKLSDSSAAFVLLMSDTEILKPSNTGRIIANVIPNTFAFLWQRNQPNDELVQLLNDPQWQPMVVFPKEYAEPEQTILENDIVLTDDKKPLFIILDGSWREARRMYRKSPYLHQLAVISFASDYDFGDEMKSRYQLREATKNGHLATAEVAARTLIMLGETKTAKHLDLWLDVFINQYQQSICRPNIGNPQALVDYQEFFHT